jgi:hypothetical protein
MGPRKQTGLIGFAAILLAGSLAIHFWPTKQDAGLSTPKPGAQSSVAHKPNIKPTATTTKAIPATPAQTGEWDHEFYDKERARFAEYQEKGYGHFEKTDLSDDSKLTPQQRSVKEALLTRQFPERLSLNITKPWDKNEFLRDPQAYASRCEPGRAYLSAQPGPNVKKLERLSSPYLELEQDKTADVIVRATPGMPVTFTAISGGKFTSTGLSSVTVICGSDGIAMASFNPGQGVIEDAPVLASCPETVGQARVVFNVRLPQRVALTSSKSN